jgi:hypothetical protein
VLLVPKAYNVPGNVLLDSRNSYFAYITVVSALMVTVGLGTFGNGNKGYFSGAFNGVQGDQGLHDGYRVTLYVDAL